MNKNSNVTNILYTHSDCKDVWKIFFNQQEKFFNIFTENYVFTNIYDQEIPSNYKQIIYDDKLNYTQRILECFKQINPQNICFFQHEDMFLYEEPKIDIIEHYISLMNNQKSNIDFIKLIKSGKCISKQSKLDDTLYEISNKSKWIFSIQPTLWNTKRFIELLEHHPNNNIWEFEQKAQKTCKKMNIKGYYSWGKGKKRGDAHWDNDIFPYIATAIVKGKWNFKEYQNELGNILQEQNINPNIRGKFMDDKIYLDKEFDKFWGKLENQENFAFLRNADGERAIMTGQAVSAQEGNWSSPNYISKLGKDIYSSLMLDKPNVYYAISCPCCDNAAYYWYCSRIPSKNITFANLWINNNFIKFKQFFPQLRRDAVLIANYRAKGHKIGNLNILKHYEINDDCISFWENEATQMIEQIKSDFGNRNDLLYVVSAGPMSSPIIAELYKNNPNNCYVDFGSAIDIYYRENISRPYMKKGNTYAKRNCWMYNPTTTDFDVSVVLNLYKRPENLELQLNALEKQTLKPKQILLYQDGTSDTVQIPYELKDKFDFIEIGKENKGVWERFRFAQKYAKSKYVCLFDDDTIPGSRWLENCHTEMLKQEGLYGTIGIILKDSKNYPSHVNKSFLRVGWDGNLNKTTEVDFVGHSWFFKQDWLKYMFEIPLEIQQNKFCGEDMGLSFQLQNHNIKTFVPPHPYNNIDLFGSLPNVAITLGNQEHKISTHPENLSNMNKCMKKLIDEYNWNILVRRNPKYIKQVENKLCKCRLFNLFKIITTQTHRTVSVLGFRINFRRKIKQ